MPRLRLGPPLKGSDGAPKEISCGRGTEKGINSIALSADNDLTSRGGPIMTEPERISPKEVYEKLKAGAAILVCAYEDDEKFKALHLDGAISFNEFRSNLPSLSKNREMVFYCA